MMKILNLIKIILLSTILLPILMASAGFLDDLKSTGEAQKAKKACENKDAKACFKAGKMFSENPSEAARKEGIIMFTKGCDFGDLPSCEYLAGKGDLNMAFKAGQLAKDVDGRKKWFGKACLGGDLKGCEALCTRGIFDDELDGCLKLAENAGKKGPSNEVSEEEIKWWLKSCDNGNVVGCGLAGINIKDPIESAKLLEKSCSPPQGFSPYACSILGFRARESGDLKKAEDYYLKSCKDIFFEDSCEILKEVRKEIAEKTNTQLAPILAKLKAACDNGGYNECLQYGLTMQGPEAQKNPWFKKACDGGVADGCFRMGLISNKENKPADAKKYFLLACDGGHPMACNSLGFMEFQKGNQAEAVKFYSKACSGGATAGCNNLAQIQIDWNNIAEARKYLNEACDSGSNAACQKLVALTKAGR